MKYITFTIVFLFTTIIYANEAEEGKKLYTQANCQKCHLMGENFDPNSINKEGLVSKVKDIKGIKSWVAGCDSFFNIGWFPEEQAKVVKYLNATYYKLKK